MAVRLFLGAAIAALTMSACAKKVEGDALYAIGECRRVALIDSYTGKAVVGAEDLAFDAAARRILISAYDRRAVERQARKRESNLDQGGIYAASLDALKSDETVLTVSSIVARDTVAGGLRPHGVTFDEARREITFVNRSYQQIDRKWRMTPRIERAGADGAVFIGDGGNPRCSANDVAQIGERTFVSFDHAACGWRGGVEDLTGSRSSGVETAEGEGVFDGVRHANGVIATGDRGLALAATRDMALFVLDEVGEGFRIDRKIELPGAPDNLTEGEGGAIIAALHPSLFAIGAQRRLGAGRGGSRVVRIDPESGSATLLFEDPKGQTFSAASAAVEKEGLLVIGSALDRGLVVCKRSEAAS